MALAQTARRLMDDVYTAPGRPRLRVALHFGAQYRQEPSQRTGTYSAQSRSKPVPFHRTGRGRPCQRDSCRCSPRPGFPCLRSTVESLLSISRSFLRPGSFAPPNLTIRYLSRQRYHSNLLKVCHRAPDRRSGRATGPTLARRASKRSSAGRVSASQAWASRGRGHPRSHHSFLTQLGAALVELSPRPIAPAVGGRIAKNRLRALARSLQEVRQLNYPPIESVSELVAQRAGVRLR